MELMSKLSKEIKSFATKQRLGFMATVCPDGSPNLSPKGLTFVYDEKRIVVGEIRSPRTIENLIANPIAEINIVDRNNRKGFRFKGKCEVHTSGLEYDRFVTFLRGQGAQSEINSVIVMRVDRVRELLSPIYDGVISEAQVQHQWKHHYDEAESTTPRK